MNKIYSVTTFIILAVSSSCYANQITKPAYEPITVSSTAPFSIPQIDISSQFDVANHNHSQEK